jgi:prepilin-type processing-associated H-X9-DG protein
MNTTTAGAARNGACLNGLFSWHATILAQLDQQPLYNSINFRVGCADRCNDPDTLMYAATIGDRHPNATSARTVVGVYLCPSDTFEVTATMGSSRPAPHNYSGNAGWTPDTSGIAPGPRRGRHNGFIGLVNPVERVDWHVGPVRASQVTDGLSQTVAVAERRIARASDPSDVESMLSEPQATRSYCGGSTGGSRTLGRWKTYCYSVSFPDPAWTVFQNRSWISGWGHAGAFYMHVLPANGRSCHLYGGETDGNILNTPSSQHPGGLHLLFGDGSVRFVRETVSLPVWWAMGSRDGGEVLSGDAY